MIAKCHNISRFLKSIIRILDTEREFRNDHLIYYVERGTIMHDGGTCMYSNECLLVVHYIISNRIIGNACDGLLHVGETAHSHGVNI